MTEQSVQLCVVNTPEGEKQYFTVLPIVSHGRVFVTCAEDSGKKRSLYCFDRRTGKQLWMQTVEFPIVELRTSYISYVT